MAGIAGEFGAGHRPAARGIARANLVFAYNASQCRLIECHRGHGGRDDLASTGIAAMPATPTMRRH
jgi:hypothetical protein